jgi:hypothetical protein
MADANPKFVQFMHPGKEHTPDADGLKAWNRISCEHRRKFLRLGGEYLDGSKSAAARGDLLFWAEWEPESEAQKIARPVPRGPQYIHKPCYKPPTSYKGLQNTDPFVFGGFFYTGCRQRRDNGRRETQLRRLDPGSVVLFGSHLQGSFVLDTVFVVGDRSIDHRADTRQNLHDESLPEAYHHVTIGPWYEAGYSDVELPSSYRLYFGATHDHPFGGLYSFFPCSSYEEGTCGFARPSIDLPGFITPGLKMGFKTSGVSVPEARGLWKEILRQVSAQGLQVGVSADVPTLAR